MTEYVAEVLINSIDDDLNVLQADKIIKSFNFDNFVNELGVTDAQDLSLRIDSLKTKMQIVNIRKA